LHTKDPEQLKRKVAEWSEKNNPFRQFLNRLADKWFLLVITMLLKTPRHRCRFSEFKKAIPGISQRMLTSTLRNLEQDGLVTRHYYAEIPPRVEYELTPLGQSLRAPIRLLFRWLKENWPACREFRKKHGMADNADK
jgi:DNA-binding HxlR family transcriptional regulator